MPNIFLLLLLHLLSPGGGGEGTSAAVNLAAVESRHFSCQGFAFFVFNFDCRIYGLPIRGTRGRHPAGNIISGEAG